MSKLTSKHSTGLRSIFTAATLVAFALPALGIDWDGNFAVDGSLDGKIDSANNWVANILPGPTDSVGFSSIATYTVLFGSNFESAGGGVGNGDVTFETLGAIQTYQINGAFFVFSSLTLDGVDFDSGQNTDLLLQINAGGNLLIQNGNTSRARSLTIGDNANNDGSFTLDATGFEVDGGLARVAGGGINGALMTLDNVASFSTIGSNLEIGRNDGTSGVVLINSGSSMLIDGSLLMADFNIVAGSAVVELTGAGSRFETTTNNQAIIGASALSTARFTAGADTEASFGGALTVHTNSTFENFGASVDVLGLATISGTFTQTGGSTTFEDMMTLSGIASFSHTGGSIRFQDTTSLQIQDIVIGGIGVANNAFWNVDDEVTYNRRLRVGDGVGTFGEINVTSVSSSQRAVLQNSGIGGNADLAIGFNGDGTLTIGNGGLVDIFDDLVVGQNAGSHGQVLVTDDSSPGPEPTTLLVNRNGAGSNLFVGFAGEGNMTVQRGGRVEVGNNLVVMAFDTPGVASQLVIGNEQADPNNNSSVLTVGGDLLVGNDGGNGGTSSGLIRFRDRALVTVDGETHVRSTGTLILQHESVLNTTDLTTEVGSTFQVLGGTIRVDTGSARFNHGDLVLNGDTAIAPSAGTLEIINGADAILTDDLIIANSNGHSGRLEVNGPGSLLTQSVGGTQNAFVGAGGFGRLVVEAGGFVEINNDIIIGSGVFANGEIEITGVNSSIRSTLIVDNQGGLSDLQIGSAGGIATLRIEDGGFVSVGGTVSIGDQGLPNSGVHRLAIGGAQAGFSAELFTDILNLNTPTASVVVDDGALVRVTTQLNIQTGSLFELMGGELFAFNIVPTVGNDLQWSGGTLHTRTVTGDLFNEGGILAPGVVLGNPIGPTTVNGNYIQKAAATLEIDIAGTTLGTQHDFLDVNGLLGLRGTLDINLIGFTPTAGDQFNIIDWNSISGTFDTINLPGVGNGNTWDISNLYTTGTLEVIRSGDLNSDGAVDGEDLDILLANWGDSVTPFDESLGDASGDGHVGNADLQIVLDQFGDVTFPSAGTVPEPGTIAGVGLLGMVLFRRRRD